MVAKFDAIVIGTGQSGPSLAARMTREGMKAAIIERGRFGGTCVNVGCTPTKTLVASARARDFGVAIDGPITVDMAAVKSRKDGIVRQSNEGVTKWLKEMENLVVHEGHGRLEGPNSVRVNGDLLEADKIILNVGGRANSSEPSTKWLPSPCTTGLEGFAYASTQNDVNSAALGNHAIRAV